MSKDSCRRVVFLWVRRAAAQSKRARLRRILYQQGLRNGTTVFLPYDQGLEHGPRDFFANEAATDPRYIVRLAIEGGFNGIAIQIGLAEKFYWEYAGEVPLILKLNGRSAREHRRRRGTIRMFGSCWITGRAMWLASGPTPPARQRLCAGPVGTIQAGRSQLLAATISA
jgi:hypothetical protein